MAHHPVTVSAGFPGGNIVVDRIDGDHVLLQQDLRDTTAWWFYWCFAVRDAGGRTLTFEFTNDNVFTAAGVACSRDQGQTWTWLPHDVVDGRSFTYAFDRHEDDVRFSFAMPYQRERLDRFLAAHADNAGLRVEPHAVTRRGRQNIRLRLGRVDGQAEHRVLLTCRHHCCEMMAQYALEGVLQTVLERKGESGRWLADHVEFMVVPMVDLDGVEDGDQGKLRAPRDHNRDYDGHSRYPTVQATMAHVPEWADGRLRVALDLHCPWIRGPHNESIYLVGQAEPRIWTEQQRFGAVLEAGLQGPLPYRAADDLPFGQGWNTGAGYKQGRTFSGWAATLPGVALASTIEIPYATAGGVEVNQATAQAFGRDLAEAIRRYLDPARKGLATFSRRI